MNTLERDQFLSRVKYQGSISDAEFNYYVTNLPANLEGSLADMRYNGTKGWWDSPGYGDVATGKALLRSALAYFPVEDNPANPRHIGVNNGIVAYAGGVAGTTPTTNDPLFLPWDGTDYLYCPRGPGNSAASTPDKAALDLTSLDIRVKVRRASWNNGGQNEVVASKSSGASLSWTAILYSTALQFYHSIDGATWANQLQLDDARILPVNEWIYLRFTGSGTAKTLYWSRDNVSWTQLATNANWSSPFNNAAPLSFGSNPDGEGWGGDVAWGELRNAINGPVVAKFDASVSGQTGYTDAQANVWTIGRATSGRKTVLVEKSCYLLGADDLFRVDSWVYDFFPSKPFTIAYAYRRWHDATGNDTYVALVNQAISVTQVQFWRYNADQSENFQIADGGANNSNSGAIGAAHGTRITNVGVRTPGNSVWIYVNNGTAYSGSDVPLTGATNPQWLTLGAHHFQGFIDHEFFGAAIFNSALSPTAVAQITAALNS